LGSGAVGGSGVVVGVRVLASHGHTLATLAIPAQKVCQYRKSAARSPGRASTVAGGSQPPSFRIIKILYPERQRLTPAASPDWIGRGGRGGSGRCGGTSGLCRPGRLGGQEQRGQDRAGRRDAAGDDGADGEAVQERVGGGEP
jgi:hypothetical protein